MADLIDKQAAIDAIMGQPPEPHYPSWYAAQIEKLPAAQPATNCSEIPNSSDDTISRQAAIEALARMMPRSYTPDGSHPADEEIFRAQEIFVDCIEALEILPSAQPEKRWIPCSERLPKVGERVLAQQINGAMQAMKCIDGGHLKWFYSRTVAWQPLPEPYRGGDE